MQKWLVTLTLIMSSGVVVLNAQQNDKQQQVDKIVKDYHDQVNAYTMSNLAGPPESLTNEQLEKWDRGEYSMNEFNDITKQITIDKIEKVLGKPLTEEQIKILTDNPFTTPKPQFG